MGKKYFFRHLFQKKMDSALTESQLLEKRLRLLNHIIIYAERNDYLSVLNLNAASSFADVVKQFHILSKYVHPDRNHAKLRDVATQAFAALNHAKSVLSDQNVFRGEIEKRALQNKRPIQITPIQSPMIQKRVCNIVVMSPATSQKSTATGILFAPGGFFGGGNFIISK